MVFDADSRDEGLIRAVAAHPASTIVVTNNKTAAGLPLMARSFRSDPGVDPLVNNASGAPEPTARAASGKTLAMIAYAAAGNRL
jgi:hypothetical protein